MATEYTVGVRFTGNSSSLNTAARDAAAAEREVGVAGQQAGAQATAAFGKTRAGIESISTTLDRTRQQFIAFVGVSQLVQVGRGVARMADDYANIGSQMRQATGNAVAFNAAQDTAYGIAQRTASSLSTTADLASKLSRALVSMGEGGEQAFRSAAGLTESIQQAIALSHVSAEAGTAAVTQLNQGLASGVLRGDELNSVMEQTPRLAQAIADGMGVTIGQLRAMGAQGLITSTQVIQALRGQAETLRTEYADLPLTIDRSWTQLVNAVTRYVGMADQAGGASSAIANGISEIANHIDAVVTGLVSIGALAATNLGGKALSASLDYAAGLKTALVAQVQSVRAEQAQAAAALDVAKAKSVETAAALEAVQASRAEQVQKLAAAQADVVLAQRHLDAASAAGVLSFAVREQRIATDALTAAKARQMAAVNELASIGRMEAGVQTTLTAAATAQVAAQERMVAVTSLSSAGMMALRKAGSSVLALMGGWPGVVLAAAAAVVYLATRQTEAEEAAAKLDATSRQLADAHGRVTQAALDEAAAELQVQRAALAASQAHLKSLDAARATVTGAQNFDSMAIAAANAARDVEALTEATSSLQTQLNASVVAKAFQENADQLAQMARQETANFDQLRGSLKDQNTELEKQIATFGKGKAAQLEYAQSLAIAAEQAKGDNNITKARIATLQALYAPLIENAKRLDAMTAASKRHTGATKEETAAHRAAAEAARDLASAYSDISQSQRTLDEQNTELRDKLAGLSEQQIEYNHGVRDAVQAYQEWIRAGVPLDQAQQDLLQRYGQLNDRLQLKNQLDAEDIKNTPNKVKSYETQTSAAERYYQVIEQGAKTAADAIGNYLVQNVHSIGDLWHGLVDSAKQVVAQIISTWLQLRVLQPLLAGVFGGGGGGWVGVASSLFGSLSSGGSSAGSTGGVVGAGGAVGGAGGSNSYAGMLSNISTVKSLYSYLAGGGSYATGAGNVASVGVGANGTAVAANPYATTYAGPYGGSTSAAMGGVPYASIAGGIMGAYYGAHQGGGGFSTGVATVGYGAAGAALAGTAAGVAGGASLGTAATGAFGAAAASTSWVPIVGWILAAAAIVDHFTGGKVFGTKFATGQANLNLGVDPNGANASASLDQWKYHTGVVPNFMGALTGGWSEAAKFGTKEHRTVNQPVTPEMLKAAQMLYDNIESTLVKGATKLGVEVPEMLTANILAQTKYDKKGKNKGTEYVVDYLGRTWKEATADLAAQRLGAEALVKVVQASAGAAAQTIAEQFRSSADTLLDGANLMLEAQSDINKGNSLLALGTTATLAQVVQFTQGLQQEGEKLADTYNRLMQASAAYLQFVGQFAPVSTGFGASLEAIAKQMQSNIDQANALAQAAGLQHAKESDLANIHQYAAKQAAAAIAQLSSAAQDLAAKLYDVTGNSLAAVNALLDKMSSKVQTAAQMAIGDNSPLSGKEKLDVALKGLRSGVTSADDVLSLGRKLYSSSADYAGLYAKVQDILQLPGAGEPGTAGINTALDDYNKLIAQRDQYQTAANATARFNDAKTLAQYVADISTTHGIGYGEAASGLGFSLQDLAKDLGVTNLTGYLDNLKLADIPGTTMDASASIVDAIHQLGRDLIQTITGGPITAASVTSGVPVGSNDPQVIALLAAINDRLAEIKQSADDTAKTNDRMAKQGDSVDLRRIAGSIRAATR